MKPSCQGTQSNCEDKKPPFPPCKQKQDRITLLQLTKQLMRVRYTYSVYTQKHTGILLPYDAHAVYRIWQCPSTLAPLL